MTPATRRRAAILAPLALIAALLLTGCGGAHTAAVDDPGSVHVNDAWMPVPSSPDVAGIFLTVANDGERPVRLVGGTTPIARTVEVHETVSENGNTTMRRLTDGLEIPPGENRTLQPGGYHLMLRALDDVPAAGEVVPLDLDFGADGHLRVEVTVRSLMDGAPDNDEEQHG